MLQTDQVEELIQVVHAIDRESLIRQFACYQANFPLDFTPQFLNALSTDRLRHIFLAVCLQSQRMPAFAGAADTVAA